MKYKIEIAKVLKDEQRMYVAFLGEETRKTLNVNIGDKIHLIGKKRDMLLEVESDKECQDEMIYINHRIRTEVGNNHGDLIYVEKAGILSMAKFSIKHHAIGYILSFFFGLLAGIIANWGWSIISSY